MTQAKNETLGRVPTRNRCPMSSIGRTRSAQVEDSLLPAEKKRLHMCIRPQASFLNLTAAVDRTGTLLVRGTVASARVTFAVRRAATNCTAGQY